MEIYRSGAEAEGAVPRAAANDMTLTEAVAAVTPMLQIFKGFDKVFEVLTAAQGAEAALADLRMQAEEAQKDLDDLAAKRKQGMKAVSDLGTQYANKQRDLEESLRQATATHDQAIVEAAAKARLDLAKMREEAERQLRLDLNAASQQLASLQEQVGEAQRDLDSLAAEKRQAAEDLADTQGKLDKATQALEALKRKLG